MIEAVMYGMMPSAKIVRRRRLPPLNRSKIPRNEPAPCWKIDSRTCQLMPGVGMCAPMRYTARRASVKRTRFRKSGMRNMFRNASKNLFMCCFDPLLSTLLLPGRLKPASTKPPHGLHRAEMGRSLLRPYKSLPLRDDLETAASFADLVFGRLAERMRVNRELHGQIAVAEDLDLVGLAANEAVGSEQVRRNRLTGREDVEVSEIKDGVGLTERIVEAALGHAAVQRHLAAFKTTPARIAAA